MKFEFRIYGVTDPRTDVAFLDVHLNDHIWTLSLYKHKLPKFEKVA